MFTGIISAIGNVVGLEPRGGDVRLTIETGGLSLADVSLGDSIACNGACLTAVELTGQGFVADVSVETLNLTTIGNWKAGSRVNLEKAMQATDRFGGHIVSGHVDGIGEVVALEGDARSWRFRLRAPREIAKYIAHKGSITVDGTSLTVNVVEGSEFELNIVPHTMLHTVIGDYKAGTKVNLEVDLVARYLERLLLGDKAADQ
ncbi:MAG: riboflavin synthase [Polaribacter sp.]|jgi:riboflavin synthase|tara:strand:- start:4817 stop:5425 length:609 start_codon:yes stop_codon:yes gene_type:complete